MPHLDRDGAVFVLSFGDGENRLTQSFLAEVNEALNEVEQASGPRALVTTATGKIWSNGLDLDWLLATPQEAPSYLTSVHNLFTRMLIFRTPTVAALQGHAFAAGAMLALAHDFRVARVDRGFFCLPEIDIRIPFTTGMSALIQARLAPQVAHIAMSTGRRFGGADAFAAGVVDAAVPEDQVLATAIAQVAPLAKNAGAALGTIKARMYGRTLDALREATEPLPPAEAPA